jgi:hypothetical protein
LIIFSSFAVDLGGDANKLGAAAVVSGGANKLGAVVVGDGGANKLGGAAAAVDDGAFSSR